MFERLPLEIIYNITCLMDNKSVLSICEVFLTSYNLTSVNIKVLKNYLRRRTKFILDNYNKKELIGLCKSFPQHNSISAGSYYSLFLNNKGKVYICGYNMDGLKSKNPPIMLSDFALIIQIIATKSHSLLLSNTGKVYGMGFALINSYSPIAIINNGLYVSEPTLIPSLQHIIFIASNEYHTLTLKASGEVYTFGFNFNSCMGIKNIIGSNKPLLIPKLKNIVSVAAGHQHSLFLDANGMVYYCGYLSSKIIYPVPTLIPQLSDIIQISAGFDHSLFLTNMGRVYSYNMNKSYQSGFIDNFRILSPSIIPGITDIISISTCDHYSLLLSKFGEVYSFGTKRKDQFTPFPFNQINPLPISELNNVMQISAGNHFLIVKKNGDIYGFGNNKFGQLGLGDYIDRYNPTFIMNINS